MKHIPQGFKASSLHNPKLSLFFSSVPCSAAGVFTRNSVQAAPVLLSKKHIRSGFARAVLINAECANAATGKRGLRDAELSAGYCADALHIKRNDVLLASTGLIGSYLDIKRIHRGIKVLSKNIARYGRENYCFNAAARAIMTTDTFPKIMSRKFRAGKTYITVWGCAKGAGMIHPDMATMLGVILTDARIKSVDARRALLDTVDKSFNTITVDGDTSTNDTVYLLANGCAGGDYIVPGRPGWAEFKKNLTAIAEGLAFMIAADGEGARHVVTITVEKAKNNQSALTVARTVATSPLVKTAICGMDPNWGRILAAVGRSGVHIDPYKIDIYIGDLNVCRNGCAATFNKTKAKNILRKKKVDLRIVLNQGTAAQRYITCDLTKQYIQINAHYTT